MPATAPQAIALRNIGVIAHIDAGKTTVTDRILFHTGRTHRLGSVDEGTTVTDWMDQERERGITIVAAAISARWQDCQLNLIDTPGHIDFTAEVQRSLRVLDGGVVVIDAAHGVEPQSETVWRQADRYRVPRLCFVNKMDRLGADFERAVASIEQRLGVRAVPVQLPIGHEGTFRGIIDLLSLRAQLWRDGTPIEAEIPPERLLVAQAARARLVEALAEEDEDLLAAYVAGREIPAGELRSALRRATLANRLFPVLCGAALRDIGIQPLLDAIVDYLPAPSDRGDTEATDAAGNAVALPADDGGPLAALVFKVVHDPYLGHLAYVRVYSGTLASGMTVANGGRGGKERIGRLVRMYANHREDTERLHAGEIGALPGLKHGRTGDTLCAPERLLLLEAIRFPEPVISATVEPRRAADQERMAEALRRLADEDPTMHLGLDENSGRHLLSGMGELHLEVLLERARREFGVELRMGRPWVNYRETISQPVAAAEGRQVRQNGGHGQYGHVVLALTPTEPGEGIRFVNGLRGGAVPRQFIPAIEQGVREAARAGVLGGYAVTGITVSLEGGSSHEVDSSELAFRAAAAQAFREGLRQGAPILLEPLVRIEVLTPRDCTGAVLGQLTARQAAIQGVEPRPGDIEAVTGRLPLAQMFGYVTELRSATQGRGSFTMEVDRYAPVASAASSR